MCIRDSTVLVMLLWYGAMARLGASRTGLFNGFVPLASLVSVALAGTGTITSTQLAGAGLVLAGVVLGLTSRGEHTAGQTRGAGVVASTSTTVD